MRESDTPNSPPLAVQQKFPTKVRAAGIIWIVFGAALVASILIVLLRIFGSAAASESQTTQVALVGKLVGPLFQAVIGGFFLYEGIECCRGTIPTTVGIAVGSIGMALIFVAVAVYQPLPDEPYDSSLFLIPAAGLLVAGVLALMGQSQYDAWWKARHGRGKNTRVA